VTPIQLVISDIDGTLTRSDKSLSNGVIAAVGRLQAAGVRFSLISARPPSGMLWIAERLRLAGEIAAFNGGTLLAADGREISAVRLVPAVARAALALIDRPGVTRWLFHAGRWHADREDPVHGPRERKSANQEPVIDRDLARLADAADKIVAVSDDEALLSAIEREARGRLGDAATVVRSQAYYLDITAPAANKGDGVAALAQTAGVPLERVAVLGDQHNDLAMFARAGLSIAMGQAPADVRAAADETTASNDDDGVARAIDAIILPGARPA